MGMHQKWLCLPAAVLVALHPEPIQAPAADCGHQHSGHRELGHLENMARAHHCLRAKPRGLRPECLGRVPGRFVQGQHHQFMQCISYRLTHWMVLCLMHSILMLMLCLLCQSVFAVDVREQHPLCLANAFVFSAIA